jgi:hypothetical protein
MILTRNIRRFWLWVGIGLLIELAAFTLWKRWYWFFPTHAVSEYYTHYAGAEGINAAFVKDYRVNDTLLLDVTVLEFTDSAVWEQTCAELGLVTTEYIMTQIPEEYRDMYFEPGGFESSIEQDTIVENGEPRRVQTVFIYYRFEKIVCIFDSVTDEQYDAIMDKEIDKI